MADVEVIVEQLESVVIETGPQGLPGPTTYLGTLGGAGAEAVFTVGEVLGGGDANGE